MSANSPGQQLNDLLITRNFDPEALDAKTGKPPLDDQGAPAPNNADMFVFDWKAESGKNYGTVVCLLGADNNFIVSFGDNLGQTMEPEDKNDWYQFLEQLSNFAKRNRLQFDVQNIRRLKYTMAGMAAIKEGLFEGYYGNRRVSYAGEPTEARLMIRHNRPLGENDARFRHVESLFIETAAGERFKLPFKKLAGGRAMLEHVRQGGTPYDVRGQHIVEMVEQINILGQFRRANHGKVFEGNASELINETTEYLSRLRESLKNLSNSRGYQQYFESWSPAEISESDLIVEDLRSLFVETRIDPRIEQALPMLAKIQKEAQAMKEAEIFESWANRIVEGTWALPETPEQQDQLKMLMSQPLPAGADGMNATEQLYDLVGDDQLFDIINDIAATDPDANCWDDKRVQDRLEELGVYMVSPAEPAAATETPPVTEGEVYDLGKEYGAPAPAKRPRSQDPDDYNPYPFSKEEDEDYFREIFRKKREAAAKQQGVVEGDNLATFEEAQCNHTMEGEYCPEHGLAECGNYGMYESQLARIKSLAHGTNEMKTGDIIKASVKAAMPGADDWITGGGGASDVTNLLVNGADEKDSDDSVMSKLGQMTGKITPNPKDFVKGFNKTFEDDKIEKDDEELTDGWKGTLAGSAAGGIAGDVAGQAIGPAAGAALGGMMGGIPGAVAGGALGALAGGPVGSALGGLTGAKIGNKLGGEDEVDETQDEDEVDEAGVGPLGTAIGLGGLGAALGGTPGALIGTALGADIGAEKDKKQTTAEESLTMESNSDSKLLARIKSLALLK